MSLIVPQSEHILVDGKNRPTQADLRKNLAETLNDAAVQSKTFYVTRNGRRIAAVVPVPVAEQSERARG